LPVSADACDSFSLGTASVHFGEKAARVDGTKSVPRMQAHTESPGTLGVGNRTLSDAPILHVGVKWHARKDNIASASDRMGKDLPFFAKKKVQRFVGGKACGHFLNWIFDHNGIFEIYVGALAQQRSNTHSNHVEHRNDGSCILCGQERAPHLAQ
jgi:hypothetical protein